MKLQNENGGDQLLRMAPKLLLLSVACAVLPEFDKYELKAFATECHCKTSALELFKALFRIQWYALKVFGRFGRKGSGSLQDRTIL